MKPIFIDNEPLPTEEEVKLINEKLEVLSMSMIHEEEISEEELKILWETPKSLKTST